MQQNDIAARGQKRRFRHRAGGAGPHRRSHVVPLTEEGVPAAVPGAPPVSRVVFVSDESRAEFPWVPSRVIAGSIWRGPAGARVRVDENGRAALWRCRIAAAV